MTTALEARPAKRKKATTSRPVKSAQPEHWLPLPAQCIRLLKAGAIETFDVRDDGSVHCRSLSENDHELRGFSFADLPGCDCEATHSGKVCHHYLVLNALCAITRDGYALTGGTMGWCGECQQPHVRAVCRHIERDVYPVTFTACGCTAGEGRLAR